MSEDYDSTPQPPDESIDDFTAPDPPEPPVSDTPDEQDQGGPDFGDFPELPTQTDDGTPINYEQSAQNNAEVRALADQIKATANQFGIDPVKQEDPPSIEDLMRKVSDLERQIQEIQPQQFDSNVPIIAFRGTDTAATEIGVLSGAITTFAGGVTLDSTYKAIDMTSSDFAVMPFYNPVSGIVEYLRISSGGATLVKPKTSETGGGKYGGVKMVPAASGMSLTTNLQETQWGTEGAAIKIINQEEEGKATHDLLSGTPVVRHFPAVYVGTDSGGVEVWSITGSDWEQCTSAGAAAPAFAF